MFVFMVKVLADNPGDMYGIQKADNIDEMYRFMSIHSPYPLAIVWQVKVHNHDEMLFRALGIRFNMQRTKSHWYFLKPEHVAVIQAITEKNYLDVITGINQFALRIRKEQHPEDYVTPEAPVKIIKAPPTVDELEEQRAALLKGFE